MSNFLQKDPQIYRFFFRLGCPRPSFSENSWYYKYTGYHYYTTSFKKARTPVSCRFKSCLRRVGDLRCWETLTMVPARNNAKRLSSVNNFTKAIHHHHHHLCKALLGVILGMHKSKVRLKFFILLKRFGDNYEQSTVFIFWKKKTFHYFLCIYLIIIIIIIIIIFIFGFIFYSTYSTLTILRTLPNICHGAFLQRIWWLIP